VTRFKELKRIEAAIAHSKADLPWAVAYCQMRLRIAAKEKEKKHWRALQLRVAKAMEESPAGTE
jgi:hypothetical protein